VFSARAGGLYENEPDAEFQDQKRKGLITEVLKGLRRAEKETFGKDSPIDIFYLQPGIWALLWFSDMEFEA
jgi:hypothetical protein